MKILIVSICLLVLLTFAGFTLATSATDMSSLEARIEKLEQRISKLESRLDAKYTPGSLESRIRTLERQVGIP